MGRQDSRSTHVIYTLNVIHARPGRGWSLLGCRVRVDNTSGINRQVRWRPPLAWAPPTCRNENYVTWTSASRVHGVLQVLVCTCTRVRSRELSLCFGPVIQRVFSWFALFRCVTLERRISFDPRQPIITRFLYTCLWSTTKLWTKNIAEKNEENYRGRRTKSNVEKFTAPKGVYTPPFIGFKTTFTKNIVLNATFTQSNRYYDNSCAVFHFFFVTPPPPRSLV